MPHGVCVWRLLTLDGSACRDLVYYVMLVGEEPGNVRDKEVRLVFDRSHDKLVQILSTVDGIASRGDLTACR
jgi:hypothetical protein